MDQAAPGAHHPVHALQVTPRMLRHRIIRRETIQYLWLHSPGQHHCTRSSAP
jgi:hypothetical protein